MKRGVFSTEVSSNIEELREFILSLGYVDVVHVVQSQKVVGAEAATSMTVIFKRWDDKTEEAEMKDELKKIREKGVAFDKVLKIIEQASIPKDLDSIKNAGKKLKEAVGKLMVALLMEAFKIEGRSPTKAVRLLFGSAGGKNTTNNAVGAYGIIVKELKDIPEKDMPKEMAELLKTSWKYRK